MYYIVLQNLINWIKVRNFKLKDWGNFSPNCILNGNTHAFQSCHPIIWYGNKTCGSLKNISKSKSQFRISLEKRAKLTWRNWSTSSWVWITSSSCWAGASCPMWNHLAIGTAGTGTLTWIPALFLFTSSVTWAVWIDQTFWSTVWWYTNVSNFTSTSCRITISYSTIWVTTARGWSAWINCFFNHRLDRN